MKQDALFRPVPRVTSRWRRMGLAVCGGILGALSGAAGSGDAKRPNVLFIVADDLRPDLGCYGDADVISPRIDSLAANGVVFDRAYCQQAVCNPSRTSVLTGLRPDTVEVWDLRARFRELQPDIVTLPQYFREQGYFTQSVGKIFHNETRSIPGRVPMSDPVSWSVPGVYEDGAHWEDWVVPGDPSGPKKKGDAWQSLDVPDEAYWDGRIANAACTALDEMSGKDQPFFLAVGFWKPHLPFNAPKKYWDLYAPEVFERMHSTSRPQGAPEIAGHNWKELRSYGGIPKKGGLDESTVDHLRHGYYAGISFLDAQVGKVLDRLDELGLRENTIIVFWGDHGFHLGEHELWGKTSNYELDARVPLIISVPGKLNAGATTQALVELVDLYPTLADLAGLPIPAALEGVSLRPQLAAPEAPGREVAITQHPHPFYTKNWTAMGYALRSDRYRYVEWRDRFSGEIVARELYDHQNDPMESINVVDDPAQSNAAKRMAALARSSYRFTPRPRRRGMSVTRRRRSQSTSISIRADGSK